LVVKIDFFNQGLEFPSRGSRHDLFGVHVKLSYRIVSYRIVFASFVTQKNSELHEHAYSYTGSRAAKF